MVASNIEFLILHVDDDRSMLELSATFLERQDERLQVETALGPEAAFELLEDTTYDAIISDYQMPQMDGLEFLKSLREERDCQIPFIIFTGKGRKEVAIDALNLGANRYLQKGGDPSAQYTVLADAVIQEVENARARASLQESESKYRGVYENAPLAFVIWDREFEIIDWNGRAADLFGWSQADAIGAATSILIPPDQQAKLDVVFQSLLEDETPTEHVNQNRTARGERIWCHWYNAPIVENGEITKVMSLALDITDSREREIQLQRYATAIEGSDDSIYMLDTDGRYIFANTEHLRRLAEDGKIDRAAESAVVRKRYAAIHPGKESDRITPLLESVIKTGEAQTEEYEFLTEETYSYRTYSPVPDPTTGEVTGVVVISKDITKRKQAEKREAFLNSLLRHDLRNKIQIAHGYHDLLEESRSATETEYLEAADATLSEGLELIEKIGLLSKLESGNIGRKDRPLDPLLDGLVAAKRDHAEDEGIDLEYAGCTGVVQGGPLLEEVFSNLLENAIKHANASQICLSTSETEETITVHVDDDGIGIPESQSGRLFERGFSAGDGAGSGLGLYLVKQIAESYDGSVAVRSSDLGGMCVDVTLKRVPMEAAAH